MNSQEWRQEHVPFGCAGSHNSLGGAGVFGPCHACRTGSPDEADLFERNLLAGCLVLVTPRSAAAYCLAESIDLAGAAWDPAPGRSRGKPQPSSVPGGSGCGPTRARFAEFRADLQTQQERDSGSLAALAAIHGQMELAPHLALVLTACLAGDLVVYRPHPIRLLGAGVCCGRSSSSPTASTATSVVSSPLGTGRGRGAAGLGGTPSPARALAPLGGLGLGRLHRLQPALPARSASTRPARPPGPDQPG